MVALVAGRCCGSAAACAGVDLIGLFVLPFELFARAALGVREPILEHPLRVVLQQQPRVHVERHVSQMGLHRKRAILFACSQHLKMGVHLGTSPPAPPPPPPPQPRGVSSPRTPHRPAGSTWLKKAQEQSIKGTASVVATSRVVGAAERKPKAEADEGITRSKCQRARLPGNRWCTWPTRSGPMLLRRSTRSPGQGYDEGGLWPRRPARLRAGFVLVPVP